MNASSSFTTKASFVFARKARTAIMSLILHGLSDGETEEQSDCESIPGSC